MHGTAKSSSAIVPELDYLLLENTVMLFLSFPSRTSGPERLSPTIFKVHNPKNVSSSHNARKCTRSESCHVAGELSRSPTHSKRLSPALPELRKPLCTSLEKSLPKADRCRLLALLRLHGKPLPCQRQLNVSASSTSCPATPLPQQRFHGLASWPCAPTRPNPRPRPPRWPPRR